MLQHERSFSSSSYRYGFNGMEMDNEIKKSTLAPDGTENSYTTHFRQYDPRVGRWWGLDPVTKSHESPFASFANNPILFADPKGDYAEPENGSYEGERQRNYFSGDGKFQEAYNGNVWHNGKWVSDYDYNKALNNFATNYFKGEYDSASDGFSDQSFKSEKFCDDLDEMMGQVWGSDDFLPTRDFNPWRNSNRPGDDPMLPFSGFASKGLLKILVSKKAKAIVLGKYPDYIKLAEKLNARKFSIPSKKWNNMTPTQQWNANRKFIDKAIKRGDKIILSNPVKNVSDVGGSYRKELYYLIRKGYQLNKDGTQFIR